MKSTIASLILVPLFFSSKFVDAQITGQSTNLCPGVVYKYTSEGYMNNTSCDFGGWLCNGCFNTTTQKAEIVDSGTNSDGTVWATVQWANEANGKISNVCESLDVSILNVAQPSIQGLSTLTLCGSGSITLQASVSSTTNITGYLWDISGTGISPKGSQSTTSPQITINYTNWNSSNNFSATVAVAAKEACGFHTLTGPLQTQTILGVTFPAIPRSAWVQLSPGNIDNLKVQYNFSPAVICTSGSMSVTNQPTGTNISWVSNSPSALQLTSAGVATRLNNYQGYANVSATTSNACGSWTENYNVWLGAPNQIGSLNKDINNPPFCVGSTLGVSVNPIGTANYTWTSNNTLILDVAGYANSGTLTANSSGTTSFSIVANNACGMVSKSFFCNRPRLLWGRNLCSCN